MKPRRPTKTRSKQWSSRNSTVFCLELCPAMRRVSRGTFCGRSPSACLKLSAMQRAFFRNWFPASSSFALTSENSSLGGCFSALVFSAFGFSPFPRDKNLLSPTACSASFAFPSSFGFASPSSSGSFTSSTASFPSSTTASIPSFFHSSIAFGPSFAASPSAFWASSSVFAGPLFLMCGRRRLKPETWGCSTAWRRVTEACGGRLVKAAVRRRRPASPVSSMRTASFVVTTWVWLIGGVRMG
mmetsp:Transcript_21979/g.54333  ORF Transcript_21979/g.54333 Transcript_21979/m.54333 type:complete len:242 (+) Transcript_21979:676-1401(+)